MTGYNSTEALAYFKANLNRKAHRAFSPSEADSLLQLAMEADLAYMEQAGVLENGVEGSAFYDDDEAFEYIDEQLCRLTGANEAKSMAIASLVDEYMDMQQAFLEQKGLVSWE